jgi:hypothetical protein
MRVDDQHWLDCDTLATIEVLVIGLGLVELPAMVV